MPTLLFPTRGNPDYRAARCAIELELIHGWRLLVSVGRDYALGAMRGSQASEALRSGDDWIVSLDDDMVVSPAQVLTLLHRAQAIDADILGCVYHQRPPTGCPITGPLGFVPYTARPHQGVINKTAYVGWGLVVVHRRVFEMPHDLIKCGPEQHGDWFYELREDGEIWRDDVAFCRRATAAGFTVRCDTDTFARHADLPGDLPT